MTLIRLAYLVHSLGNCAMTLPTETGLSARIILRNTEVYDKP